MRSPSTLSFLDGDGAAECCCLELLEILATFSQELEVNSLEISLHTYSKPDWEKLSLEVHVVPNSA
jgi:hypothetical protein